MDTKFKLTDGFIDKYKHKKPPFGFNGLGELVYLRTYSRIKSNGDNERWWETIQRVVEGTFNMQKKWIEQHKLGWNAMKSQKSAQEMYDRMFSMKFLPPGRGLWAMGSSITEDRGMYMALNNPLGLNTKILTKEHGWIEIGDIDTNEITVLTSTKKYARDHGQDIKSNSKWVSAKVSDVELHPCLEITYQSKFGDKTTVVASKNHRWFRKKNTYSKWERVTSEELNIGDWMPSIRPPKYFKYSNCGVQHGLFFGDGTRSNGELHQFGISNIKVMELTFPKNDLENLPPLDSGETHVVVRHCPLAWGEIPTNSAYLNDNRYIMGFLMGYFCADGYIDKSGTCSISSARLDELENVANLFKRIGIRTTSPILSSISSNFCEERELYKIEICKKDLPDYFFLKESQNIIFESKRDNQNQDWLQIICVKEIEDLQNVRCVTVPEYEQFVIDGFCITSNCAYVSTNSIKEDLSKSFCFLMDVSMLGVGCGFDVKGAGKITIYKPVACDDNTIQIPDTREGWVDSIRFLIDSYFNGSKDIKFDYSIIRVAGLPIKTFGGVSSGSEPLMELHKGIRDTLNKNIGDTITITTIVDIMNLIGKCVVSGNVRRTAEIVFGDYNSSEYLDLKNYKLNPSREAFGWTSNNSIFCDVGMDYSNSSDRTKLNGEPGYAWLENMKSYSRMNDVKDNKDHRVEGGNPCLEQSLESYEVCNLVETFPHNHETLDDFLITLKYAYLYAKTVTLGQTHWPETNRVMLRNRRIGCSMSGIVQFIENKGLNELKKWCEDGYKKLEYYDEVYSDWLAIPKSIKRTSIKPSGTVSLLAGATPGVHFPESVFYTRRMRLSKHSDLIEPLENAGYKIEPCYGSEESTVVVEIPVKIGDNIRSVREVSIWEQAAMAAFMQKYWADNQVSCTISFKKEEANQIKSVLNFYQYQLKGISFLPILESGGVYRQMPYETITKDEYDKTILKLKPIKFKGIKNEEADIEKFCTNDTCEIKALKV